MRCKRIITILSVLLVVVAGYSIYLNLQTISKDEMKEREEILIATLPVIDIAEEEIEEIVVLKAKAGIYPYMYNVAVNMKDGRQILYRWADETKTKVIKE